MTSTHVLRTLSALFAAAVSSSASAATHTIDGSAYVIDGQYTAVLQQRAHRWRLVPYSGGEVDVTDTLATCGSSEAIPTGLWYVSRDAHDKVALVAPSATELPDDYPQEIAMRACGDKAEGDVTLFVPAVAMNWISGNVGAILIDD